MDLKFIVNNQSLNRLDEQKPSTLSQKYLYLSFDFQTSDWNGLVKFAIFTVNHKKYRVALVDDKALVPNACLESDTFMFSVYGLDDDDLRVTTNQVMVYLSKSGFCADVENDIPDDDPTIVEAIYLAIDNAIDTCENYADAGLSSKSDVGHKHVEADITDLQDYALSEHTHTESDITDLGDYIEKSNTSGLVKNDGSIDTTVYISDVSNKADKTGGVAQVTDANANNYTNLGTLLSGATQQEINSAINTIIGALKGADFIRVVSDKGTASADTMEKLYIEVGETTDVYYTTKNGNNYSWNKLDDDILDNLSIDWSDIQNKPTIPDVTGKLDITQTNYKGKNVVVDDTTGDITFENKPSIPDVSGKIDTAGTGLIKNATTLSADIGDSSNISAGKLVACNDSRLSDARTPLSHVHDDRYYTEEEVNQIIDDLKYRLKNRVGITGDKSLIQAGDIVDVQACLIRDEFPVKDERVYFYKKIMED